VKVSAAFKPNAALWRARHNTTREIEGCTGLL